MNGPVHDLKGKWSECHRVRNAKRPREGSNSRTVPYYYTDSHRDIMLHLRVISRIVPEKCRWGNRKYKKENFRNKKISVREEVTKLTEVYPPLGPPWWHPRWQWMVRRWQSVGCPGPHSQRCQIHSQLPATAKASCLNDSSTTNSAKPCLTIFVSYPKVATTTFKSTNSKASKWLLVQSTKVNSLHLMQ